MSHCEKRLNHTLEHNKNNNRAHTIEKKSKQFRNRIIIIAIESKQKIICRWLHLINWLRNSMWCRWRSTDDGNDDVADAPFETTAYKHKNYPSAAAVFFFPSLCHSLIKIEYVHIGPQCYVERRETKIALGNSKQWIASLVRFLFICECLCTLSVSVCVCECLSLSALHSYIVEVHGKSANSLHLTNLRCALCSAHDI